MAQPIDWLRLNEMAMASAESKLALRLSGPPHSALGPSNSGAMAATVNGW
jgi:hypothetical protein